MRWLAFLLLLISFSLHADENDLPNKNQIPYLMQVRESERSINLYLRYKELLGKHDFEILQQMALILLDQGARSLDQETQLLSIYGSGIASISSSLDVLEAGIKSSHAETQVASIQFLGSMQDDRSDELLVKAMSSQFFFARMEAAYHLAMRKHPTSVGQIESLMYRIPPQARFFFPQFFALIGTQEAISILRHLMEDRYPAVRVEALLSAAKFNRDDLLPTIRSSVTHLNMAEQEAAAFAVGLLKDSKSVKKLKQLLKSSSSNVSIGAARALYHLGDQNAKEILMEAAQKLNLFAIVSLADIVEGKELLARLCRHPDLSIRINAAPALLRHRDPRCMNALIEVIIRDVRDIGFQPQSSPGRTMMAFKPVYSTKQQKSDFYDVQAVTLAIREQLLRETIDLPENVFLQIAEAIFESKQTELIPVLVSLLENKRTPACFSLLKACAEKAGAPLVRSYCNLSLYRLGQSGPYEKRVKDWVLLSKNSEIISFRPLVPIDQRIDDSPYQLTPKDHSRLLIESYQALSDKHEEGSLNLILEAIRDGNHKNRYVLAGLLLRTMQ